MGISEKLSKYSIVDWPPTAKKCLDSGCADFIRALISSLTEISQMPFDPKGKKEKSFRCGNQDCRVVFGISVCKRRDSIALTNTRPRMASPACLPED